MKLVQIYKNGDMKDLECNFTKKNIIKNLTNSSKSQGNNSLKLLYTWKFINYNLICYGWYDGEAGFENKHDLPPSGVSSFIENDSSEKLLFGDLFILKTHKNKFVPLSISEYSDCYNQLFGGFDDCDTDDDESISEEEYDEDYNTEEEENISDSSDYNLSDCEKELDEDTNEY